MQLLHKEGIRVNDSSHFFAKPYLSLCQAASGVEAIKMERLKDGDVGLRHLYSVTGQSGYFLRQDMGKKVIYVNAKDPQSNELLQKLCNYACTVIEQDHPTTGKVKLPNLPFRFSDCDTTQTMPAPLLGQHNREIARSVGLSDAHISQMEHDDVLYAEPTEQTR